MRPFADHRRIIEGIIYRYRTGVPWRDLPREAFGPWQTVWKRHRRWAADDTWDTILAQVTAQADSINGIDWTVSVDSTSTGPTSTPRTLLGRRRTPALPLAGARAKPLPPGASRPATP